MIRLEKVAPETIEQLYQDISRDVQDYINLSDNLTPPQSNIVYNLRNSVLSIDTNVSEIYYFEIKGHTIVFCAEKIPYRSLID